MGASHSPEGPILLILAPRNMCLMGVLHCKGTFSKFLPGSLVPTLGVDIWARKLPGDPRTLSAVEH